MSKAEFVAGLLGGNLEMLKFHVADFSDADMMVRPVPGANHAAWQLGHLAAAEVSLVKAVGGTTVELPAGWAERFHNSKANVDDAKALATKQEILDVLAKVRAGSIQWARSLTPEQFDVPAPEKLRMLGATAGGIAAALAGHTTMHIGQIQVIRRKLGKPVLF
jgi:hypothetical protein